jgi:predicted dehydrogenase
VVLYRQVFGQEVAMTLRLSEPQDEGPIKPYYDELNNFLESIKGTQKPVVDGWQALAIIQLVEDCYARPLRIPEPWSEIGEIAEKAKA